MPTKYQAQVKMTPKAKPSQMRPESATPADVARNPTIARRPISGAFPPLQSVAQTAYEAPKAGAHGNVAAASSKAYAAAKRSIDLLGGSVLLVLSVPVILFAAAIIRLETKGSPFFVQTRLGKNGTPFKIFKLRGMFIDAKMRFASYYDYSRHQDLEFCFHHEDDPRVTRAGKFIRKASIDELPNLWNVVRGDMSLVGPRPEIPEVLALYGSYRDTYLSVKPGITCLSKVTGRDRLTKRETIEFDLDYIRRRSFSLDLKILWRTFRDVIIRRDVF
jgi:lipopolysaccharide/colanic/teichoic acid biosynthesis glycosyltransferase